MQPYLFLSRDGVDGVHALAKCIRCLHACCTDAHPGSCCRGAVLLREDGWLRRRHWLPALALEGRWRGGRRRRRQWRRQVASSYQMLAISFRRAAVGLHDLWIKMLFFSYYELPWWEVLTRILHFPFVSPLYPHKMIKTGCILICAKIYNFGIKIPYTLTRGFCVICKHERNCFISLDYSKSELTSNYLTVNMSCVFKCWYPIIVLRVLSVVKLGTVNRSQHTRDARKRLSSNLSLVQMLFLTVIIW